MDFRASEDLSFVIGSFLGDGSFVEDSDYHHYVKLAVRDKDFAEAFNLAVASVLRRKPNKLTLTHDLGKVYYESKYSSRPLGLFLESSLEKLRRFADAYPAAFLKGLFSADGCASVSTTRSRLRLQLILCNSDRELLQLVESILESRFQIHSKTYLVRRKGATWKNGNKVVVLRMDAYALRIQRVRDVRCFVDKIGFVIARKQRVAARAIYLTRTLDPLVAGVEWRKQYSRKKGSRWDNLGSIE